MADHTYKFNITMACSGCSGAVTRNLKALREQNEKNEPSAIRSYNVDLESQSATVITGPELDYETVLGVIVATKKKVNSGEADGQSRSVEVVKA